MRHFQSDRWLLPEVLRDGFDEAYIGIADAHRVIKGLADNERLKTQFFMAPIGIDPINQTVGQASRPVERQPASTIRTQSGAGDLVASQFKSQPQAASAPPIPRNAPCPCHSGLKYKRCCGTTAAPVLHLERGSKFAG